jgi:hypothetical protein
VRGLYYHIRRAHTFDLAEEAQPAPNYEVLPAAILGAMVGGGVYYLYQERSSLSCPSSANSEYAMGVATGGVEDKHEDEMQEASATPEVI